MTMPIMIVFGIEASRGHLAAFAILCTCSCSYPCHRKTTSISTPRQKSSLFLFLLTDGRCWQLEEPTTPRELELELELEQASLGPRAIAWMSPPVNSGYFPISRRRRGRNMQHAESPYHPIPRNPFPPFVSSLSSVSQPGQSLSCPRLWPVPCGAEQHLRN